MYKDTANRMPKQAAHGYAEVQPAFRVFRAQR